MSPGSCPHAYWHCTACCCCWCESATVALCLLLWAAPWHRPLHHPHCYAVLQVRHGSYLLSAGCHLPPWHPVRCMLLRLRHLWTTAPCCRSLTVCCPCIRRQLALDELHVALQLQFSYSSTMLQVSHMCCPCVRRQPAGLVPFPHCVTLHSCSRLIIHHAAGRSSSAACKLLWVLRLRLNRLVPAGPGARRDGAPCLSP